MGNKAINIYLIRHGRTKFNDEHLVQGWSDSPLTDEGRASICALGRGLRGIPFDAVYTSDLNRTIDTTNIILEQMGLKNLIPIRKSGMREWYFGGYESKPALDMQENMARGLNMKAEEIRNLGIMSLDIKRCGDAIAATDSEKLADDYDTSSSRIMTTLKEIYTEMAASGRSNGLIVSHGMTICTILHNLGPIELPAGGIINGSVSRIVYEEGHLYLDMVNDSSFIERGLSVDS